MVENPEAPKEEAPPAIDVKALITKFVKLRDKIAAIKEDHKAQLPPYNAVKENIEGVLMTIMNSMGVDNLKADGAGTVSKLDEWSCTINDKEAFRQFVIDNDLFELIDIKANASRVREHLEETKALPPGVNLSNYHKVGVRRASGT